MPISGRGHWGGTASAFAKASADTSVPSHFARLGLRGAQAGKAGTLCCDGRGRPPHIVARASPPAVGRCLQRPLQFGHFGKAKSGEIRKFSLVEIFCWSRKTGACNDLGKWSHYTFRAVS